MLKKLFRKKGERLFLSNITVVPRKDFKRHLEAKGYLEKEDVDAVLRHTLEEIFDLPKTKDIEYPQNTDLAIEVIIPRYQSGDHFIANPTHIFLFWRPKVELAYRLFYLKTGKTLGTATVTEKLPWNEFVGRICTLRGILRYKPLFDADDINRLMGKACVKLLKKLKKATS